MLGQPSAGRIESIAVLPLENLSRDPEQEYFADGMTDELIVELAKFSALRVISRTSVMQYKGTRKTLPEIARELRVDAVVEGSAIRSGDRIRVRAQLIEAATDRQLWAKSYDRDLQDVLVMQDELTQAIANEIKIRLTPQERVHLEAVEPVNREAHDAYLRGRYLMWQLTPAALQEAIGNLEQSIRMDPRSALPYAGLAYAYASLPITSDVPPRDSFLKAKQAAAQALALDDNSAEAHVALCVIRFWSDWDWAGAEEECREAIALNANYAIAYMRYAHVLSNEGRHSEAMAEMERGRLLDPFSPWMQTFEGFFFYQAHQYEPAIEQLRRAVALTPNFWVAHIELCKVYEQKGMFDDALTECHLAYKFSGGNTEASSLMGHIYAAQGKRSEAQREIEELNRLSRAKYVPPYNLALIYMGLGNKQKAMEWLEKAYLDRDIHLVFLRVEPKWDAVREDPRFQDLLRRIYSGQ